MVCSAFHSTKALVSQVFPPERGLLRMIHRYINKGRNWSRLFVRERVELLIELLGGDWEQTLHGSYTFSFVERCSYFLWWCFLSCQSCSAIAYTGAEDQLGLCEYRLYIHRVCNKTVVNWLVNFFSGVLTICDATFQICDFYFSLVLLLFNLVLKIR